VRSAASYAEADALIPSLGGGDIIVADYHLDSAHTGIEVLMKAREVHESNVPGIVLSGDLPSLVRSIHQPIPASKFLSKPVDTEALLQAIRELTAADRDQDERSRASG
jgi:CheY-like chemotaxis protein